MKEPAWSHSMKHAIQLIEYIYIYRKYLRKCAHMMLCDIIIMMYQPGKRSCTIFFGGNSDCRAKFAYNFNFKDTRETLPSCKEYEIELAKIYDKYSCWDSLNRNFLHGKFLTKFMHSNE